MRKGGLGRNYGIDFWSFCVCEFHCSSLVAICDSFFKCMGYTGIPRIGLFNADVAALSAFSLPVMPTWLGNQQNTTLKDWVERLLFWYNLTSNGMFKENLVNEAIINHDSNRERTTTSWSQSFHYYLFIVSKQSHENDIQYTKVTQKPT